jgi:hypothetical protein
MDAVDPHSGGADRSVCMDPAPMSRRHGNSLNRSKEDGCLYYVRLASKPSPPSASRLKNWQKRREIRKPT